MLYEQEYRHKGGHPDWNFSRKKFEDLDIEEKTRNELVKQALDRMLNPEESFEEDTDANRQKRMVMTQEREFDGRIRKENKKECPKNDREDTDKTVEIPLQEESNIMWHPEKVFVGYTKTVGNIHKYNYIVPTRIYYDEQYRKRLDKAETLAEVEQIIRDYDKHHRTEQGDKQSKKHW